MKKQEFPTSVGDEGKLGCIGEKFTNLSNQGGLSRVGREDGSQVASCEAVVDHPGPWVADPDDDDGCDEGDAVVGDVGVGDDDGDDAWVVDASDDDVDVVAVVVDVDFVAGDVVVVVGVVAECVVAVDVVVGVADVDVVAVSAVAVWKDVADPC